jgi:nucleoside-diphosphate-sugar epimerase
MSSNSLVIGCGYLGRRVADLWRQEPGAVHVTTRKPETADRLRADGFLPIVCDVLDPASLRALPAAWQVLYAVGMDRTAGATMRQVYVEGLRNVLDHLGPCRLVYISSTSIYGQTDGSVVEENSPTEPADEAGRIVLEAERLLRERRRDAIILRFAGMYGPGRLLREQAIRTGQPLSGDPAKWLNLIHIDDGAKVVCTAYHRAARGSITNVADGHPVTRGDFYAELARLLGAPAPTFTPLDPGADPVNRRIGIARLRHWFGEFLYPDYRAGLAQASGERGASAP